MSSSTKVFVVCGLLGVIAIVLGFFSMSGQATDDIEPLEFSGNGTGISPGIILIDNFCVGRTAQWTLLVRNGGNATSEFAVYYRIPDKTREGYTSAGNTAANWLSVEYEGRPEIQAGETKPVTLSLRMPVTWKSIFMRWISEAPAEQWEFWVGVMDQSQTGMVRTELCQRVLVTMR